MTTTERFRQGIAPFLPAAAVDAVCDYMMQHKVHVTVTSQRATKLGDYRAPNIQHPYHAITFNDGLNPYMTLHVLLHEMAHLDTFLQYKDTVEPHGHEWQECFRHKMIAFRRCYPTDALSFLDNYTERIPLNRAVGRRLEECLRCYTPGYAESHAVTLDDLAPGSCFHIASRPSITFRAIEKRRTRWLCEDLATHARYIVSGFAPVTPIKP